MKEFTLLFVDVKCSDIKWHVLEIASVASAACTEEGMNVLFVIMILTEFLPFQ